MIDESFVKSNFLGRDGFIWWIGQVADPKVWRTEKTRIDEGKSSWGYRCKIRIIGYHSFDRNELKDEDLPWAHVLTSAADGAPAQGGFGKLPLLVGGESVFGFFLDGEEAQQPVIMSCFYRSPMVENIPNPNPFEPFAGAPTSGPLGGGDPKRRSQSTRNKRQDDGVAKEIDEKIGEGSQFEMFANPLFGAATTKSLDLSPGFAPITTDTSSKAGAIFGAPNIPRDQLFYDEKAEVAFLSAFDKVGNVETDNGCGNNILSQITNTLQSFIKTVNGLEKTALGFIDPVRNVVVDVQQTVRSVARIVASIMKFVINGMRDSIFCLIGKLFKVLSITLPSSIKLPISEAAKNILNLIFCLFEKLFGPLMDFIKGLLNGLIGKSPNIPLCAIEEITSALVNKLADMADNALSAILSGLDWLASGISSIAGALTSGLNMISQILSFLSCDSLACQSTTSWNPFSGASFPALDSWNSIIGNMDVLSGLGGANQSLGYLSMFGSSNTPFSKCRKKITNPQTQDDLAPMPIGVKFYNCIPPEIRIYGDGVGARAKAVVSEVDGSIVTFLLCDPGKGYTYPPEIRVVDNSNHGKGAQARATVSNGGIDSIYVINPGTGYCQTNLTEETGGGAGTASLPPCLDVGDGQLSPVVIGITTNFVIGSPGIGYTFGDTIQVGDDLFKPVITDNGSIIDVEYPSFAVQPTQPGQAPPPNQTTQTGSSGQTFKSVPPVIINTRTGEGAIIYPVLQFVPQFITDTLDQNIVGIGSIVNVVDCV
jgi:hypothetical protein